jgi:hypothetical protein
VVQYTKIYQKYIPKKPKWKYTKWLLNNQMPIKNTQWS